MRHSEEPNLNVLLSLPTMVVLLADILHAPCTSIYHTSFNVNMNIEVLCDSCDVNINIRKKHFWFPNLLEILTMLS